MAINVPLIPFKGRIEPLDTVRGIAILGIFLLNIFGFALPQTAYLNPYYSQTTSPADAFVWMAFNLFFQGKVLAIFSLLFGATLALLQYRQTQWNCCRLAILAGFGVIHSLGFWHGDILLSYALTGLVAIYMLGHYSEAALFKIACVLYLSGLAILVILGSGIDATHLWQVSDEQALLEAGEKVTGGVESLVYRTQKTLAMIELLFAQYGWQLLGMMIIGALLMKNGWLRGQFSSQHYRKMALILITPALIIQVIAFYFQSQSDWSYFATAVVGYIINQLVIPFQSLGYIALVYGFWNTIQHGLIIKLLQSVGRMALSNYLLQTILCTTIFYHLGYYGQFTRIELLAFIVPIWAVNLIFSYCWLQFYQ